MRSDPLKKGITREEFHRLVTDLYYRLAAKGHPASNPSVEEEEEVGRRRKNAPPGRSSSLKLPHRY